MRTRIAAAALTSSLLCLPLAGCGTSDDGTDTEQPPSTATAKAAPESSEPRTPEEFLARARQAMSGEPGWTFTVAGSEGLASPGGDSTATYTATVDRTTDNPMTLHSTGTTRSKGVDKPEEVYVVDGTAHVKKGTDGAWKSGPVTDPEMANVIEDPLTALDAFAGHGEVSVRTSPEAVELRAALGSPATLSAVRDEPVAQKAVREFQSTLDQLRAAGVSAPDDRITVESVEETVTLDPSTYRLTAHRFRCVFLIPYQGRTMRYSQDVSERTEGVFTGTVTLPAGVAASS
ncbi:hypothetical protein [Streptomyces sp. NPDC018693]|uniref:hypothetical protein n=1 Tax=unclassified Streptomyces TaxID=2593676 RepID=UPI0037A42239